MHCILKLKVKIYDFLVKFIVCLYVKISFPLLCVFVKIKKIKKLKKKKNVKPRALGILAIFVLNAFICKGLNNQVASLRI